MFAHSNTQSLRLNMKCRKLYFKSKNKSSAHDTHRLTAAPIEAIETGVHLWHDVRIKDAIVGQSVKLDYS